MAQEIIQKKCEPNEVVMTEGIHFKYYDTIAGLVYMGTHFGRGTLTDDMIKRIMAEVRIGKFEPMYFSLEEGIGEEDYMEIACNYDDKECKDCKYDKDCKNCKRLPWLSIAFTENYLENDQCYYLSYNAEYADSDEESCIIPPDGQSVVPKVQTIHDLDLATKAIEYVIRTGQPYPGMVWLKWTHNF